MKAVRIHAYGDDAQLRYEEVATPEPGPDEVLVELAATSVNPIDWKMRSGAAQDRMPVTFPAILGRDLAGTVVKIGVNVRSPNPGQKVMGFVSGSYAEFIVAPAHVLTVIPDGLDIELAGALPLVTTTGAQLIQHLQLKREDKVIVTGALGSVGRAAVYLAKHQGAFVIAGIKSEQKEDAGSLGADQLVGIDDEAEMARLPQLDAIADTIGHDVIGKLIPKLRPNGVLGSVVGKPKEAEGKPIRVEAFMAHADASVLRQMADAVRDGKLDIPIARKLKLSHAAEAHRLAEKGSTGGKILLLP
jgi:NADPH:quinone reductase-like Zn-dependent oxidoreductase